PTLCYACRYGDDGGTKKGCWIAYQQPSSRRAPRIGLNTHRGFVELGAFTIKQLRQTRSIEFHAWTSPKAIKEAKSKPKPKRDPLRLARYYQSLLDTGKFESRAALARHLGVSRANVTQVLNRLKKANESETKSA
ncbi:MAG: hypothetical protein ACI814_003965, partial [Mariniblastus sp.]